MPSLRIFRAIGCAISPCSIERELSRPRRFEGYCWARHLGVGQRFAICQAEPAVRLLRVLPHEVAICKPMI